MEPGEENAITTAKELLPVKTMNAGKATSCDEMLKALNGGVLGSTLVCQMACRSGRAPIDCETEVIIPIHKNWTKTMQQLTRHFSPQPSRKVC